MRLKKSILLGLGVALAVQTQAQENVFRVDDIRVEGLQRISAGSVFNALPISVGDSIDESSLSNAAKVLFSTGNFDDLSFFRDDGVLVVNVKERPSISEINIEGNKAIKTEALLDGLKGAGLAVGRVLKRSTLEGMQLELQRQYVSQGRYDAKIETEVEELPRNRAGVNIIVDEGSVAKIKHLNVVGNTVYDNEELVDLFELNTTGWFSFITGNDKYSKEKLGSDLETLESYYKDRGYIRYNLESTQVAITPDRDAVYITANIKEGDKYTINDVSFTGDIILEEEHLRNYLLSKSGQVFSQLYMTRSEEFVTNRLGDAGYTFAKVTGIPEINDEDKTVDIKFFVDPGKRTYVRRINFKGNTKTVDEVLRREMRQMESAPASRAAIEHSKVRLERTGFFKEVEVETPEVPGADDLVDVEYTVEEQSSGSIGASVGFAQSSGLILSANLQQNNFLGTGKRVGIGISNSRYQTAYNFSYVNPYYTVDGVSRGFSVFYRKTDLDEINVSRYSTDTFGGSMNFGYPLSETQRIGFSLGYTNTEITVGEFAVQEIVGSPRPVEGLDKYIITPRDPGKTDAVTGLLSDRPDLTFQTPEPGFLDRNGNDFNLFPITASWSQSTLNRGQLATRGASQGLSLEISLPGSDLEYYKLTYNAQYFYPINNSFTLRFRTELGYGDGYGDTDGLPFFKNFFAGGFGSVRGFKSNTLGPRSTPAIRYGRDFIQANPTSGTPVSDLYAYTLNDAKTAISSGLAFPGEDPRPFGGNASIIGSVELLFPLPFVKDQRSLRSGLFVDVGNVFNTECGSAQLNCFDIDAGELRSSVGIGLTWITGFGPLTFSLAKPINKGPDDDTEIFQFSLGRGF